MPHSGVDWEKNMQGMLDLRLETDKATGPTLLSQDSGMEKSHFNVMAVTGKDLLHFWGPCGVGNHLIQPQLFS